MFPKRPRELSHFHTIVHAIPATGNALGSPLRAFWNVTAHFKYRFFLEVSLLSPLWNAMFPFSEPLKALYLSMAWPSSEVIIHLPGRPFISFLVFVVQSNITSSVRPSQLSQQAELVIPPQCFWSNWTSSLKNWLLVLLTTVPTTGKSLEGTDDISLSFLLAPTQQQPPSRYLVIVEWITGKWERRCPRSLCFSQEVSTILPALTSVISVPFVGSQM